MNKNGEVIRTAIKPGTRVRVYYANMGDLRMVDRVVVDRSRARPDITNKKPHDSLNPAAFLVGTSALTATSLDHVDLLAVVAAVSATIPVSARPVACDSRCSGGYFSAFFCPWRAGASREGCLASARRSVFFRRLARFLALSLPLLCPISLNF